MLGCLVLGCYLLLNTYNLAWLLRPGASKLGALMAEHRRDYTLNIQPRNYFCYNIYFGEGQLAAQNNDVTSKMAVQF